MITLRQLSYLVGMKRSSHSQPLCRTVPLYLVPALSLLACSAGVQEIGKLDGEWPVDGGANMTSADASSPEGGEDAATPSGLEPGCVRAQYSATLAPLDMFILLDQSGSMNDEEDRFTPTTRAIDQFVGSADLLGTYVALNYFPLGANDTDKCTPSSYGVPDVPMGALPGQAAAISSSMAAHYFPPEQCCNTPEHAGTPTRPAIEGAAQYMRAWLTAHPTHQGILLLATDGEPSSVCADNTASDVAQAVADALGDSPALRTYVIGIGYDKYLNEIAEAGGTGRGPLIVDGSGAATEKELLEALSTIRGEALPCDYAVPEGPEVDLTQVNVQRTRGVGAAPTTLRNVKTSADCAKAEPGAWYYDDSAAAKRIVLCPATCQDVSRDLTSTMQIVVGCQTVVI